MLTIEKLKAFGADTDEALARCMNNEQFYLMLVNKVLGADSFERLDAAVCAGDLDETFAIAHTLKGSLGNLSLTPLFDAVAEMTELLRAKTDTDYAPYIDRIKSLEKQLKELSE